MELWQCDRCKVINDTVQDALPLITVTATGGIETHRYDVRYFTHTPYYENGDIMVVFPFKDRVGERIQHICMECIKKEIAKSLTALQNLLTPFIQIQQPSIEYISTGRMLTKEQQKALKILQPLLLEE